ncbi:MAG: 16S rRNA (guanine(966)-N(2))-methyltransferase RsmD [Candidatus Melainabacteria bacterium RIFOXYA12_FULL_32_12]|nr:MAG: 16S rRNA (guanine(966)-N(2))-methyltransferase RsmD [Candidatus Melainabacteria bacterium RIFOXYA2_FULL_32_9]OGI26143.1 MAG: 16S rRNA (guanine(966)-N(2))-methyltransferase RsmD [Candidatus Melainabacteria bacterium RIFOXYA12_FULL_32_12]
MIITGGSQKGRKIKTVKSREVRPTSSKVRESIFNIIQSISDILHHGDAVVLDLFAGSGILGLEAFSRGPKKVIYVEKSPDVASLLKENLAGFDLDYELIISDAILALDRFKNITFDLIFIDPPYASGLIEPSLSKIKSNNLLNSEGIIVVEHSPDYNTTEIAQNLGYEILREKKYGDTAITILSN